MNLCKVEINLSTLSFWLFAFIFPSLSRFCHFLIVVNDKFCTAKVNSRFLVFCSDCESNRFGSRSD